jgi:uroporphyrin-III C-methyltransferase
MKKNDNHGKVIIIGAGPGDPDLITVKAVRYLRKADVVLTDRLVSPAILTVYVSPGTEIIYVGKQANKAASASQADINKLLIRYANEGKLVVRLKGGDVSVFSNILDELQALKANCIPYEIVPGITAAMGAAAYSGIPLTARTFASGVRFLSYYKAGVFSETDWKELAGTDDTLVFYMSGELLDELVEKLIDNQIHHSKLLAIIEQATTPLQNVHTTSLYQYKNKLAGRKIVSPSIIIIGRVVALHKEFNWINNSNSSASFFGTIESKLIQYKNDAEDELLTA